MIETKNSTTTISRTAVVTAADWFDYQMMTPVEQDNWLDQKWREYADAHGQEFGEAWPSVPFNPRHDHRLGCCNPPISCANDSFSALVAVTNAVIDEGPVEDYKPTPEEIAANAGPTLVTICHDFSSDAEHGNAGQVMCWDVEASANSPQWSAVGYGGAE